MHKSTEIPIMDKWFVKVSELVEMVKLIYLVMGKTSTLKKNRFLMDFFAKKKKKR